MGERSSRNKINKEEINLLEPLDIYKYGSDDDPCFGKLHDLLSKECQICGDSDFCAIIKSQNLHTDRITLETGQRFKDIEEADSEIVKKRDKAKELILKYKDERLKRTRIILKVYKELNLAKEEVKLLYDIT